MLDTLQQNGFTVLPAIFTVEETEAIVSHMSDAFVQAQGGLSIRTRSKVVYAARNVDEWFPEVRGVWRKPALLDLLRAVLGDSCGLVRVLFFDKPADQPWSLPWHKDMTITVQNNRLPSELFCNPTTKSGIPHIEAPESVLKEMLTLRLHLDAVDDSNGPLMVVPGSHHSGKQVVEGQTIRTIHAGRGDVLAIRPLVSHCSPLPTSSAGSGRRILHFEFATTHVLPDGYTWRMFEAIGL